MSEPCESSESDLSSRIERWTWRDGEEALSGFLLQDGKAAQLLSAELLKRSDALELVDIIRALGRYQGVEGVEALRSIALTPARGMRDPRCVAILALVKRLGAACVDD